MKLRNFSFEEVAAVTGLTRQTLHYRVRKGLLRPTLVSITDDPFYGRQRNEVTMAEIKRHFAYMGRRKAMEVLGSLLSDKHRVEGDFRYKLFTGE